MVLLKLLGEQVCACYYFLSKLLKFEWFSIDRQETEWWMNDDDYYY
jgi:hypothetical protein